MKNPAYLFYPGDWQVDTAGMSRVERDCYHDLHQLQFSLGSFTEYQAKNHLKEDFAENWLVLKYKFIEEDGRYYNEQLRQRIEERKAYVASRKPGAQALKAKIELMKKELEKKEKELSAMSEAAPEPGAKKRKSIRALLDNTEISKPEIKAGPTKKKGAKMKEEHIPVQKQEHLSPQALTMGIEAYWQQMTEPQKKQYRKDIWDLFFQDRVWIKEVCKMKAWSEKDFSEKLKDFLKDQALTDDIARGEKALQRHFLNKYKKQIGK